MNKRYLSALVALPLVLSLLAVPPAHATGGVISGNWVITQAAQQAQGIAPKVVACGTFTLTVPDSQIQTDPRHPNRGVYTGLILFDTTYTNHTLPPAAQPNLPVGLVGGAWMIQVLGPVFVNFKGTTAFGELAFGSFVSPAPQPHPSIGKLPPGCVLFSNTFPNGFLGLLHLPGQGTEGATLYSDKSVDTSIFTR